MPPGDYFAVALDAATERGLQRADDVDPRELLRKVGISFSLADAETRTLPPRVMTPPDR